MQDSLPSTHSRRTLLRAGAAGLSAVTAGAAGCLSALPPLGSQIEFGRVDVPAPPRGPVYRRWTPSPESYAHEGYHGSPVALLPAAFADDPEPRRTSIGRSVVLSAIDYLGQPFEAYDLVVTADPAAVIEGPIRRSRLAEFLTDTGYSQKGRTGPFDWYDRPDGDRVLAVTDGTAVFASGEGSARAVEYLIELAAGEHRTRYATDETFAAFCDRVGTSPSTMLGFPLGQRASEEATHAALSFRFDDEAMYYVFDHQYPSPRDVSQSRIREELRRRDLFDDSLLVDIEVDGEFVTIELRQDRPVGNLGQRREIPQIMWGWTVDRAARTITLRHEAGDAFPAEHATIEHDGVPTDTQFQDEYDEVAPGATLTVPLPADSFAEGVHVSYHLGEHSTISFLNLDPEVSP